MVERKLQSVLMVEDDPGHARLIEKNLHRAQTTNDLMVLHDGQQALDYLLREQEYAGAQHPVPEVILLDLNLPGLDGFQLLTRLKSDARTRHIPVIILTTSDDPDEMKQCHTLGCDAYFTKPVDYADLFEVIHTLTASPRRAMVPL
jgi:CheY-like chemotaxis protein